LTNRIQFTIHEGFTTGEDHLLYVECPYGFAVPIEIGSMKCTPIFTLPDIAHDAAAVAQVVYAEHQDRELRDARLLQMSGWCRLNVI
jgi:hypothetical protein